MSRGVLGKNNWALVLLILVGVVLGGLIGKLCTVRVLDLSIRWCWIWGFWF